MSLPVSLSPPRNQAIDVEVDQGPGLPFRLLHVNIDENQLDPKPYIGGYRHKRSGVVFHHAMTQTPRQAKFINSSPKPSRECQTVERATCSAQTVRESATQMKRPGLLLCDEEDR